MLGVCSLLNIPFVVIVQAHLLRDKGSVRLRRVLSDDLEIGWHSASGGSNEQFVPIESLASTIREMSAESNGTEERISGEPEQDAGNVSTKDTSSIRPSTAEVECVYVDQENFFSDDAKGSKSDKALWKGGMKVLKSIVQRSESYLSSHLQTNSGGSTPVFAVADVPFWVLRDFGTALMRREKKDQSAVGACVETTEAYPKGKRPLKTLATAIDIFMRKRGIWEDASRGQNDVRVSGGSQLLSILLYSKLDDRFDMVSLEGAAKARYGTPTRRR